jgi:hypothetical protein
VYDYVDSLNEEKTLPLGNVDLAKVGQRELNFVDLNKNVRIKTHLIKSSGMKRFLIIDGALINSLN